METFSALLAICAGNSPVPMSSPHNGQWRGALVFSLICAWINRWVNTHEAGDLSHRAHNNLTVMYWPKFPPSSQIYPGISGVTWSGHEELISSWSWEMTMGFEALYAGRGRRNPVWSGKEAHWSLRGLIVKSAEHCGADYKPLDRTFTDTFMASFQKIVLIG